MTVNDMFLLYHYPCLILIDFHISWSVSDMFRLLQWCGVSQLGWVEETFGTGSPGDSYKTRGLESRWCLYIIYLIVYVAYYSSYIYNILYIYYIYTIYIYYIYILYIYIYYIHRHMFYVYIDIHTHFSCKILRWSPKWPRANEQTNVIMQGPQGPPAGPWWMKSPLGMWCPRGVRYVSL